MHPHTKHLGLGCSIVVCLWFAACTPATRAPSLSPEPPVRLTVAPPTPTQEPQPPTNPLTGLGVAEPYLLKVPALLISISHFPATARPQAGLSFAPFVYEFYITEGATRFLAIFYGEWPAPSIPVSGGCEPRIGPFGRSATLLGNRVWLDANQNGLQDPSEVGVAGLCVNLYDSSKKLLAGTTSDTNGYYGFDVPPGQYAVEFVAPEHLAFTARDAGDDALDSDVDPPTGTADVDLGSDDLSIDAGMIAPGESLAALNEGHNLPLAQVGPIRSGRLIYRYLARTFQDSCLIFAYASPEVLERLPQCKVVFHQIQGGGYMLDLSELWSVAQDNQTRAGKEPDYPAYEFSNSPLPEGRLATALQVFIAYQNQSAWYYDPLSESYLRYVDTSERALAGILHPETDRLTGRQLQFQNVIILFAKHHVISPTNLDILLDPGKTGKAILFRDGLALNIDWSAPKDQRGNTGGPIQFLQKNGEPVPLKPGHTWVIVVTPETAVKRGANGIWQLTFAPPAGAK